MDEVASQRLVALAAIDGLRESPVSPYRDGRPVARVIEVVGRVTGEPRPFGVNVTRINGHLYVCSATRERDWVRNLLAARRCRIERDGPGGADSERVPVLVVGREAAVALATYLPQSGYHDPLLPFEEGASVDEIERWVDSVAVFRLDPAESDRTDCLMKGEV
ncbi:hypothetical protein AB0E69_35410 [Kribbella sp. NPDC026611]|uniref:hypothetical protein n=1 Tax=Kribbella sp. NPDC026611 TaxID=3154911 RepID=UPI0033F039BC